MAKIKKGTGRTHRAKCSRRYHIDAAVSIHLAMTLHHINHFFCGDNYSASFFDLFVDFLKCFFDFEFLHECLLALRIVSPISPFQPKCKTQEYAKPKKNHDVCPKPPLPLAVSSRLDDSIHWAWQTFCITICARRMPLCTTKAVSL